MKKTEK